MEDAHSSIHRFNVTALALFERLYSRFPDPIDIRASEIGIFAAPDDVSEEAIWSYGFGADFVVTWLAEEGFVRYDSYDGRGKFYRLRLSLKGLTVLGYVPVVVEGKKKKEPIIDRVRKTLADGTEKAGSDAVKAVMGSLFRVALQHGMEAVRSVGA